MKRGEIWTASGGGLYAGKSRPVLILQADRFEFTHSVSVCLFTTASNETDSMRILIEPSVSNGLRQMSRLMADKVSTFPRSKLGSRLGTLAAADLTRAESAIRVFLGLGE